MKDMQARLTHAFDELRRVRDEIRVKLNLLGKDADDALDDAEELLKLAERKLEAVAGRARTEAHSAAAYVRGRLHRPRAKA